MIKDLTGQRFGRLTVIEFVSMKNSNALWRCKCDCGNLCNVKGGSLTGGTTQSCGCLQRERASEVSAKHRKTGTRIYRIWADMKRRCLNVNRPNFERYGGRGVTVCDEWRDDFQAFFDYVSKLEHFGEDGYTLDRIDNSRGYEIGNVRWATAKEQSRNRRSNVIVEYKGENMTLIEAAERSGIPFFTLRYRYSKGKRGENLFAPYAPNKPHEKTELVEYAGEMLSLKDAAKRSGVNYYTLLYRYKHGKRGDELFKFR